MIEIATIFGWQKLKQCASLHGAVFECTIPTVGKTGFSLSHIVQWSTSVTRPDEGEDLAPDIKKTVKFLELCLELDPRRRMSARAALASDFLAETDPATDVDELNVL